MESTDNRVKAIRQHALVGCGSCSVVDECYTDEEIIAELNKLGAVYDYEAVKWALLVQEACEEQERNFRYE